MSENKLRLPPIDLPNIDNIYDDEDDASFGTSDDIRAIFNITPDTSIESSLIRSLDENITKNTEVLNKLTDILKNNQYLVNSLPNSKQFADLHNLLVTINRNTDNKADSKVEKQLENEKIDREKDNNKYLENISDNIEKLVKDNSESSAPVKKEDEEDEEDRPLKRSDSILDLFTDPDDYLMSGDKKSRRGRWRDSGGLAGKAKKKGAGALSKTGNFIKKKIPFVSKIASGAGKVASAAGKAASFLTKGAGPLAALASAGISAVDYLQADTGEEENKAIASGVGGTAGSLIGGALGMLIPIPGLNVAVSAAGSALGGYLGSTFGSWLGGLFSDITDTIPNEVKDKGPLNELDYIDKFLLPTLEQSIEMEKDPDKKEDLQDDLEDLQEYRQELIEDKIPESIDEQVAKMRGNVDDPAQREEARKIIESRLDADAKSVRNQVKDQSYLNQQTTSNTRVNTSTSSPPVPISTNKATAVPTYYPSTGGNGYAASINFDPRGILTSKGGTDKSRKAAALATGRANRKSTGYCARYVRMALQGAGYKFESQPSAYMYATRGILEKAGFTKIDPNSPPQVGDVSVIGAGGSHRHGHISIFNGTNWVSDFIQKRMSPYSSLAPGQFIAMYRDMGGQPVEDESNKEEEGVTTVETKVDGTAPTPQPGESSSQSTPLSSAPVPTEGESSTESSSTGTGSTGGVPVDSSTTSGDGSQSSESAGVTQESSPVTNTQTTTPGTQSSSDGSVASEVMNKGKDTVEAAASEVTRLLSQGATPEQISLATNTPLPNVLNQISNYSNPSGVSVQPTKADNIPPTDTTNQSVTPPIINAPTTSSNPVVPNPDNFRVSDNMVILASMMI